MGSARSTALRNVERREGFRARKLVAKHRWNPWFKAMIAITLSKPYRIEDDDDTKVYRTRTFFECTPNYLSE